MWGDRLHFSGWTMKLRFALVEINNRDTPIRRCRDENRTIGPSSKAFGSVFQINPAIRFQRLHGSPLIPCLPDKERQVIATLHEHLRCRFIRPARPFQLFGSAFSLQKR